MEICVHDATLITFRKEVERKRRKIIGKSEYFKYIEFWQIFPDLVEKIKFLSLYRKSQKLLFLCVFSYF